MIASWIGPYQLGGAKGLEPASIPNYQNLSNERLLHKACVAEDSLRGHTKSASIQWRRPGMSVVNCADDVQTVINRSIKAGQVHTWPMVAHMSRTPNIIFPRPGQGSGQVASIIWSRCVWCAADRPLIST